MQQAIINLSSEKDDMKLKSISAIEERLVAILKEGPHTRDQLVKKLDLPRTTIYDGLRRLIERNEVKKFPMYIPTDHVIKVKTTKGYVYYTWRGMRPDRGRPQVLFSLLDGK
jgi:predicted ArsR family transcriptional regulator